MSLPLNVFIVTAYHDPRAGTGSDALSPGCARDGGPGCSPRLPPGDYDLPLDLHARDLESGSAGATLRDLDLPAVGVDDRPNDP